MAGIPALPVDCLAIFSMLCYMLLSSFNVGHQGNIVGCNIGVCGTLSVITHH